MTDTIATPSQRSIAARNRAELASFLRTRRGRLQPDDVGIASRGHRRVPGLRRHEVADLAAVSTTLYTWLEQGRPVGVSTQALDAVTRALGCNEDEARYVRRLAGNPVDKATANGGAVEPAVLALVDDLLPAPAYLATPTFDLVAWNAALAAVFTDPAELAPSQRNALHLMLFTDVRDRLECWDEEVADNVARFRSAAAKYPELRRFDELTERLKATSPAFGAAWASQEARRFRSRDQAITHPRAGTLRFTMVELSVVEHSGLTLVVHRPADIVCRRAVEALLP